MKPAPTPVEVERIAALGDPLLRNLQITQCYYELSARLTERTGPVANWCTFATWASNQAGQTIRREDLHRALEGILLNESLAHDALAELSSLLRNTNDGTLRSLLLETFSPESATDRSSDAVARGNQKVFAEIGLEFARFAAICQDDAAFDAEKIDRFCNALRPGEPPDGQQYLRQAFRRYYLAFFEQDRKAQGEYILLANLEIGFHEQTRLQPEIAEALNAALVPPGEFARRLLGVLFPYRGWLMYAFFQLMQLLGQPSALGKAIDGLYAVVQLHIRRFMTKNMMELRFPQGFRLRLGDDLRAAFPPSLRELSNPELRALLQKIDPTPDSLTETGATDWADLSERMHFIADMFRCFQETDLLLEPPFNSSST